MHSKVRFVQHSTPHYCNIEYTYEDGSFHRREFGAPANGGYVYENLNNPRQICEGLARTGWALRWDPNEFPTLADLLRHEHRRAVGAARYREAHR